MCADESTKLFRNRSLIPNNGMSSQYNLVADEAGNIYGISLYSASVLRNGKPILSSGAIVGGCKVNQFTGLVLDENGNPLVNADYRQADEAGNGFPFIGIFNTNGLVKDFSKTSVEGSPLTAAGATSTLVAAAGSNEPLMLLYGKNGTNELVLGEKILLSANYTPGTEPRYASLPGGVGNILSRQRDVSGIDYASPPTYCDDRDRICW